MEGRNSEGKFTKGNSFWQNRSKHGRDAIFEFADLLREEAEKYFIATDERKWTKKDWVGKDAMQVERENETPYTLSGLCVYLHTCRSWWNATKKRMIEGNKTDFIEVIEFIEEVMFTQKFEGAAVGAFNANIISRELGLVDKVDSTVKSTNTTFSVELTKEEANQINKDLEREF